MANPLFFNRFNLLLIILCSFSLSAFTQVTEDFSDGDFTLHPSWTGSQTKFLISEKSQLQLNDSGAGISYLVTASKAFSNASWEFYLEMDFNPSSQNYSKIYLAAQDTILSSSTNSFFIMIGGSNDDISLYKEKNEEITKIIDGEDARLSQDKIQCKIRATRDSEGKWTLWSAVEDTSQYQKEGEITDLTAINANYFGIYCEYTSTRSNNFYFDDIKVSGDAFVDTIPPKVLDVTPITSTNIWVELSEPISAEHTLDNTNFELVPEAGNFESITVMEDPSEVSLVLEAPLINGQKYILNISNIADSEGNLSHSVSFPFLYYKPETPDFRDIVINEIMVDPTPRVGLPEAEFIEIYNKSDKVLDLTDWVITDDESKGKLGPTEILPQEYLILCSPSDTLLFKTFGRISGVPGIPSLNNNDGALTLIDNSGIIIDQVYYSKEWYKSSIRNEGGYSLEMIDYNNPCSSGENWSVSENLDGGTPGKPNSIMASKPDKNGPILLSVFPTVDSLTLTFNEILDPASVLAAQYFLNNEQIFPEMSLDSRGKTIILKVPSQLEKAVEYTVEVKNIKDCNGNSIDDQNNRITFGLPETADSRDIVINEILFNPRTGGVDFVELYNNTGTYINLRNWTLANIDVEKESGLSIISNRDQISGFNYLLAPQGFVAITTDVPNLHQNYPKSIGNPMIEMNGYPSFPDDAGTVVVLNDKNEVVDSVGYNENYHSPIINQEDGVSLERISYDKASQDQNNWTSAASTADFATPGMFNSQSRSLKVSKASINIEPRIITPDNNGIDDYAIIQYTFENKSYMGNVYIYDFGGTQVYAITEDASFSKEGFLKWEGINDQGEFVKIGVYMLYMELFDFSGEVKVIKEPIVVGTNF